MRLDHPDDDVLADLGAGVLEGPDAGEVEAHVIDCPTCLALVERAEALTGPLGRLAHDEESGTAPAMPDDVLARLEQVVARTVPAENPGTPVPEKPAPQTGPTRVLKPMTARAPGRGGLTRLGARRQQLDEERDDDRSDRLMRYGRWAAAAVLVVGVGTGAVAGLRSLGGGQGETASTAAGGSTGESAAVPSAVLATGTNYTGDDLEAQVKALVADARSAPQAAAAPSSDATDLAGGSASRAYAAAAPSEPLSDPARLNACLAAIGHPGERPVAVDLARYQEREAAIIVLQQPGGGYDVWAVSRDCAPGADGTIDVESVGP